MAAKPKVFKKLGRTFTSKVGMEQFSEIMERLAESNPDALMADGFEDALIGSVERFGMASVALYDREKCIDILVKRDGMTADEADEFFEFNTIGAGMGEGTPAFASISRDAFAGPVK